MSQRNASEEVMRKCTHEAAGIHPVFDDGMAPERKEYLVRLVEACRQRKAVLSQDGYDLIIDGSYSDIPEGSPLQGHGVVVYGHDAKTWTPCVIDAEAAEQELRTLLPDDWDASSMPTADEIRQEQLQRLWDLEPLIERCLGLPIVVGGIELKVGGFDARYGSSPLCLTRTIPSGTGRPYVEEDFEDPRMLADELRGIARKADEEQAKGK